jgi:plastocyanin
MRIPALILVSLVVLGCSGSGGGPTTPPVTTTVVLGDGSYTPQSVTAPAGSIVSWQNSSVMQHTITPDVAGLGPNSVSQYPTGLAPSNSFQWTVPTGAASGTQYFYHCIYHGNAGNGKSLGTGMAGVVVVQ